MKQIKWGFLLLAVLAAASIVGIGVAIAEESVKGVLGSLVTLIVVMGFGFSRKRKMLKNGEL